MKTIPVGRKGIVAIVDDQDYELVSMHRWYADWGTKKYPLSTPYARTNIVKPDGKCSTVTMHRVIFPNIKEIDHKDRNRLNNQRDNLRDVTHSQNMANASGKPKTRKSKHKGVVPVIRRHGIVYVAYGTVNKKTKNLGTYVNEDDAVRARNVYLSSTFGEGFFQ